MKKPRKLKPKARPHRSNRTLPTIGRALTQPGPAFAFLPLIERRMAAGSRWISEQVPRNLSAAGEAFHRMKTEARAIAVSYSREEREALALLFLPFLLVATVIVSHQSARGVHAYLNTVATPDTQLAPVDIENAKRIAVAALPLEAARETAPDLPDLAKASTNEEATVSVRAAGLPLADATTRLALLAPDRAGLDSLSSPSPSALESFEADEHGLPIRRGICALTQPRQASLASAPQAGTHDFGMRLARAAEAQTAGFVIYNNNYRSISYPMGDVNGLFGVCTDVVIRAYRALGLDLQMLVHQARAGRGDTSIDHRRTEVLRRFFAAHGRSLPVTTFAEDYEPGDIVTYYRPQNRGARAHIAVVSSIVARSGRPMIVHNRGWGPQLEDGLFVDQITGHYRYTGPQSVRQAAEISVPAAAPPIGASSPVLPASVRSTR